MKFQRSLPNEEFLALTAQQQAQRLIREFIFIMYLDRRPGLIEKLSEVAASNPNVLWDLIEDANSYSRYVETSKGPIARLKNTPYPVLKSQVLQFFWEQRNGIDAKTKKPYKGPEAFAVAAYEYCDANRIPKIDSSVLTATLAKRWLKELQEEFPMHWHSKKKQAVLEEQLRNPGIFPEPVTRHFPDRETMDKYFADAAAIKIFSVPYKKGSTVISN